MSIRSRRNYFKSFLLIFSFLILSTLESHGRGTKNLLPRLPELIIEKGYSDAFQVVNYIAHTTIYDETAESSVQVTLKNISDKSVTTSIKFRILYLLSEHSVKITVGGKNTKFDRRNPRVIFTIAPGQEIVLNVTAKHLIEYSLQNEKPNNLIAQENDSPKFGIGELVKLFEKEDLGKRLIIGTLVSKWGIFPVDFKHIRIDVTVPREFIGIFPVETTWTKRDSGSKKIYSFEGTEGYNRVIFLPHKDLESVEARLKKIASTTYF